MPDNVSTEEIFKGTKRYIIQLKNESDGTGESVVTKVNLDDLISRAGIRPSSLTIEEATWDVAGFNYVTIYWDRDPDPVEALVLKGNGYRDYSEGGGLLDPQRDQSGTGNILLSTDGGSDGASYSIVIHFRLKI
jgi:hypothetical protein